jgi:hypothetical protein
MAEQQQPTTGKVFAAIKNVMADIAKEGVGKNQTNTSQNFKYRGVDDVMDALSPLLAKHDLLILPSVESHTLTERATRSGSTVLHALLKLTYEFVCPIDGSTKVVGPIYGEAMDTGDKATNKAMATAYKYACVQTFCIPITGDDPDSNTHEIAGAPEGRRVEQEPRRESPSHAASSPPPARPAPPPAPDYRTSTEPPDVPRPGGIFSYGKKFRDVPWNVMKGADLEWFLNAERTPNDIRHKIVAEMAWRDYETAQMERVDDEIRKDRERPLEEDIP